MKNVNYIVVPTIQEIGMDGAQWHEGKCVSINEGNGKATIFLAHYTENVTEYEGETEREVSQTRAFAVRLDTPVNRANAINACEMEAYGLRTAMDVASFNASLARKARMNPDDDEVREHDEFMAWVKAELDKIGITSNG